MTCRSALLVTVLLFAAGCGDHRGPGMTLDYRTPAGSTGPFTIRYAVSISRERRLLVDGALHAHYTELDKTMRRPAWQVAMSSPTPIVPLWPQRNVYVYDVPLLRTRTSIAAGGYVDGSRGIHLVAGEGDTLPEATAQILVSMYYPYGIDWKSPVLPLLTTLQAQTVADLRKARGLP